MTWAIFTSIDKPVTEEDLDKAVADLPFPLRGDTPTKQSWGWLCAVNIARQNDGSLVIRPGNDAVPVNAGFWMQDALALRLERLGYKVAIQPMARWAQ